MERFLFSIWNIFLFLIGIFSFFKLECLPFFSLFYLKLYSFVKIEKFLYFLMLFLKIHYLLAVMERYAILVCVILMNLYSIFVSYFFYYVQYKIDCCLLLKQFMELKPLIWFIGQRITVKMHWLCMDEILVWGKFHCLPSFCIKIKEAIKADKRIVIYSILGQQLAADNCSCNYM